MPEDISELCHKMTDAVDDAVDKAKVKAFPQPSQKYEETVCVAAVSDDLIGQGLKAGDWIRDTAKAAGGGGGGKPQMAQAGGKDPSKLRAALQTARQAARVALGIS